MLIEIANHTTREVFRSKNGFTLLGDNGLILGYVQTDEGEHVVEIERLHIQQAVLSHFKSREDAIKFMCTFEDELPRLHTVYDKLHTHTGVGAFRVFNPITSYPFHVGLDSDTHLHYCDIVTGETTAFYAEQDAEVTRDYFMKTMNSVLHELIYSKPQGMGYQFLPFLPTLTQEEKLSFLQGYIKHNTEGAVSKQSQVDPNRPVIQPSDTPYNFEDIHKIIENSTYHPPKCPFSPSGSNVHAVFLTDPHLSDILGYNLDGQPKKPYEPMPGEQLKAFVKQMTTVGSASKDLVNKDTAEVHVEVPKPRHVQVSEEKQDKRHAERKQNRGNKGTKSRNRRDSVSGGKPKSPYTSHRRKQK